MATAICDSVVIDAGPVGGGDTSQTITFALDGQIPKLLVFYAFGTAGNTNLVDARMSYGMTDGTNMVCASLASDDGATPASEVWTDLIDTQVIRVLQRVAGTVDGEATILSFGVNQAVINWGNAPGSAWKVGVFALAGTDVSAMVTTGSGSTSIGGSVNVAHGLFAVPTGMIGCALGTAENVNSGPFTTGRLATGYASYRDGGLIFQSSASIYLKDNTVAGYVGARASDENFLHPSRYSGSGGVETAEAALEVTKVDATNVELTTRVIAASTDFGIAVISGVSCYAGMQEFPSGTGVKNFNLPPTVVDFTPIGVLWQPTRINYSEINQDIDNVRAGTMGWGSMSSESSGAGVSESQGSIQHRYETIPVESQSMFNVRALNLPPHTGGTAGHRGDWDNYDSDGFGVDVTGSVSSSKAFPQLLFGLEDENLTITRGGYPRGRVVAAGSIAGRTAVSGSIASRGGMSSRSEAGRVSASGSVAGRIVAAGSIAGRISHAE